MSSQREDRERFSTMAETYHRMCRKLVPNYDFLQDELLRILPFGKSEALQVVDLGSGSGILLERILTLFRKAKGFWVDSSEDFLKVAKSNLERDGFRITYILTKLEDPWESRLEGRVDLIVSMSAIHHLSSQQKKRLYERCYDVLNHGGWFFNVDEMKTVYGDAYLRSMLFWIEHVEQSRTRMDREDMPYYEKWNEYFTRWRIRNVDCMDHPRAEGDDWHETFADQLEWLREAGFVNTDLFVKYHLWSLIGGQKVAG